MTLHERLSFVLPVATKETGRDENDLLRLQLVLSSLSQFFDLDDLAECWIVCPTEDLSGVTAAVRQVTADARFRIVPENEFVPEFAAEPDTSCDWPVPNVGWYRQQIIKLAACEVVTTPLYVTLDADVICVKPFAARDLLVDGRAKCGVETRTDFERLYIPDFAAWEVKVREERVAHSERIFGKSRPVEYRGLYYSETPVVFSRSAMRAMAEELSWRHAKPWKVALLESLPWTEQALYFHFLETSGSLAEHYEISAADSILRLSDSLWQPPAMYRDHRDLNSWDVDRAFASGRPGVFVVVQSYLGLPVPEIADRIREYVPTPAPAQPGSGAVDPADRVSIWRRLLPPGLSHLVEDDTLADVSNNTRSDAEWLAAPGSEPETVWRELDLSPDAFHIECLGESQVTSAAPLRLSLELQPRWEYGALIRIRLPEAGPYLVRITASVLSGQAAFGVLNSTETGFLHRTVVSKPEGQPVAVPVDLPVSDPSAAGRLVVQMAESDEPARVLIELVQVFERAQRFSGRTAAPTQSFSFLSMEQLLEETMPLLRAYAPGVSLERICELLAAGRADAASTAVAEVLEADRRTRRRNALHSPARAALHRLRAELLLRKGEASNALVAAKMAVSLDPGLGGNLVTLHSCLDSVRIFPRALPCLGLIVTCDSRQDRCSSLHRSLTECGWIVRVVSGAGTEPRHNYDYLIVDSGDAYEDLALKVRQALLNVYETYGEGTAVLKMDDDLKVEDLLAFTSAWSELALDSAVDYSGVLAPALTYRDWHFNKCARDDFNTRPYGKRADWPYAHGPCYYLSGKAMRAYYEYNARFPDEIMGSIYEDVFMGKVMLDQGFVAQPMHPGDFGIASLGPHISDPEA